VLRVAPVANDERVVVWAVAPGEATLSLTVDGDRAMNVPVVVTDPP
jgi:hypothetical protein